MHKYTINRHCAFIIDIVIFQCHDNLVQFIYIDLKRVLSAFCRSLKSDKTIFNIKQNSEKSQKKSKTEETLRVENPVKYEIQIVLHLNCLSPEKYIKSMTTTDIHYCQQIFQNFWRILSFISLNSIYYIFLSKEWLFDQAIYKAVLKTLDLNLYLTESFVQFISL